MSNISLNTLLGTRIKKLSSGSELMFFLELVKYTRSLLGLDLVLEDIQIIKEIRKGDYFSYIYSKGINLNCEAVSEDLVDVSEVSRKFFNSDLSGLVFEKQTDSEWVYDYNTNRSTNLVLNKYNRSGGYVSLFAFMVVLAYKENKKVPKLILKNTSPKQEELEYVDILVLKNFGNCLLNGKVDIIYSKEVVTQPEWEAYIMYNRQLGFMLTEIKPIEKYKYILKNFEVGDVVLIYKTEKSIKSKTIRRLVSCHPAVIRGITKTDIKLEYYPDITTLLTRKRELEEAEDVCGGDYKYSHEDYSRFASCALTLDYYNLGVDLLLYLEDEFILSPQNGVDSFKQYIVDKNGIEGVYHLSTLDTIYSVFEDRKVLYNKEKFITKYFKKSKPIYDVIKGIS